MFTRCRFFKKFAWLFITTVTIILGLWGWYSFRIIRFNCVPSSSSCTSESKLSQLPEEFGTQQETVINVIRKSPASFNSSYATESKRKSLNHKTSLITTTTCVQHYFLLILVSSAPSNVERRKDLRQTWGVDFAIRPRWKTAFLVARTQMKSELDSLLEEEDEIYGDLVRANHYEHYWNQTLKIQMGFEWAAKYCKFSFLLKIDDDVFVNTKALITLLMNPETPKQKLYMGNRYEAAPVHRSGKWEVTFKEYSRTHYPDFCPGFGYVLSADVVVLFVDLFDVVSAFRLDDVYVGMLADKAAVKTIHNDGFIVGPEQVTQCILQNNTLVWHGIFGNCLFEVYNQIMIEANIRLTVRD